MRLRNIRVGFVLVLAVYGLSACAQTQPGTGLGEIRQEMEQLKQEYAQQTQAYEQRLKSLDERLRQLETAGAHPAAAPSAMVSTQKPATDQNAQAGATSASQNPAVSQQQTGPVQKPFTEATDSIQLSLAEQEDNRVRDRMERVLREYVDISGYFRAGYGRDDQGVRHRSHFRRRERWQKDAWATRRRITENSSSARISIFPERFR